MVAKTKKRRSRRNPKLVAKQLKSAMTKIVEEIPADSTNRIYRNRDGTVDGEIRVSIAPDADLDDVILDALEPLNAHTPDGFWVSGGLLVDSAPTESSTMAIRHGLGFASTHYMRELGPSKTMAIIAGRMREPVEEKHGREKIKELLIRFFWSPTGDRRQRPGP